MTTTEFNTTARFGRVITAMVTPFFDDGAVDYAGAAKLASYLVANGSDGLVVAGTTGESATLGGDEKLHLFRTVKQAVGGRAHVLAGTGSYNTAETLELSRRAGEIGVDGLLIVTPYYNRPSQDGLYAHYRTVAEQSNTPIMLYNVPGRTGVNLEASTVLRLAEIPGIVAVKEASKSMDQVGEIVAGMPDGFEVYSGDDPVTLPILSLGGVGVISVISHVVGPALKAMHEAFFKGDVPEARRLHLGTLPITRAMFSIPSPVPTKTALAMLGVLERATVRLPLVNANEREANVIRQALIARGLLPA